MITRTTTTWGKSFDVTVTRTKTWQPVLATRDRSGNSIATSEGAGAYWGLRRDAYYMPPLEHDLMREIMALLDSIYDEDDLVDIDDAIARWRVTSEDLQEMGYDLDIVSWDDSL